MIRYRFLPVVLFLTVLPASATIDYTVSLAQPEQHVFHVTMKVPDAGESLVVQMPAWNALYQIRDFAHRVRQVRVQADAAAKPTVQKLDKQTWTITQAAPSGRSLGTVAVEYNVEWDDASPFSAQLDSTHAFVNFAMVLLYIPERRREEVRVRFVDMPEGWSVAAALRPGETSATLRAASYDALVDAPVEISRFEDSRFLVGKARIRVVVHGTEWDRGALRDSVERIVAYQTRLMDEVPFEEFLFIFHFGMGGGGGMEHANSTAIHFAANAWAAGITAHEFFHTWNVKRIRPRTLEPACPDCGEAGRGVDYTRENWTRALWFAEGVTSTYGSFTLVRTGLWSAEQFYDDLASEISTLEARPARLWQSVEEASLDTWLERYGSYNQPARSISYYNKGQILGFLLDVLIRDATGNRHSLDDVLRHLNAEFAHKGRFYNDSADIRAAVEKAAGRDFGDFFSRYVAGTEELPWAEILARAGLELAPRDNPRADFGFAVLRGTGGGSQVGEVRSGTPAQAQGLRAGDTLLELEGAAFPTNTGRWLREHRPGESVRLRVRRGDEEREVTLVLASRGERFYSLREIKNPTEKQRRIREGMLRGTTDAGPGNAPGQE